MSMETSWGEYQEDTTVVDSSDEEIEKIVPLLDVDHNLRSLEESDKEGLSDVWDFLDGRNGRQLIFTDVNGREHQLLVFSSTHVQQIPEVLPEGYVYMGGVARNVVLQELGDRVNKPRDFDSCAITDLHADMSLAPELSARIMPHDSQTGHGIGESRLDNYFMSRDFVLNEVFVRGNDVYITPQALRDLRDKIIRPSDYEYFTRSKGARNDEKIMRPALVMRAMRLENEFKYLYGKSGIVDIPDWQFSFEGIGLFNLMLGLTKASQMKNEQMVQFYFRLLDAGIVDLQNSPEKLGGRSMRELVLNAKVELDMRNKSSGKYKPFVTGNDYFDRMWHDVEQEWDDYEHYAGLANDYSGKISGGKDSY